MAQKSFLWEVRNQLLLETLEERSILIFWRMILKPREMRQFFTSWGSHRPSSRIWSFDPQGQFLTYLLSLMKEWMFLNWAKESVWGGPRPNICSWQEERKERMRTGTALTLTPQLRGPWQPLHRLPLGTLHGGNQWLTALPAGALGPPELTVYQDTTRPKKGGKEETQRNRRIMGDAFTMTAFADLGPQFFKISFIVA